MPFTVPAGAKVHELPTFEHQLKAAQRSAARIGGRVEVSALYRPTEAFVTVVADSNGIAFNRVSPVREEDITRTACVVIDGEEEIW